MYSKHISSGGRELFGVMDKAFDFELENYCVVASNPIVVDFSCINTICFHGSMRIIFKSNVRPNSFFRNVS